MKRKALALTVVTAVAFGSVFAVASYIEHSGHAKANEYEGIAAKARALFSNRNTTNFDPDLELDYLEKHLDERALHIAYVSRAQFIQQHEPRFLLHHVDRAICMEVADNSRDFSCKRHTTHHKIHEYTLTYRLIKPRWM